ncbi:MAG: hypothetical protein R3E65_06530 [Steroidobacteraceae bacterium]
MTDEVREHALEPFFTTKAVMLDQASDSASSCGLHQQSGARDHAAQRTWHDRQPRPAGREGTSSECARSCAHAALLVEDHPMLRCVLERTLSENSLRRDRCAIRGRGPTLLLQGLQVDCLFTDIRMPDDSMGSNLRLGEAASPGNCRPATDRLHRYRYR